MYNVRIKLGALDTFIKLVFVSVFLLLIFAPFLKNFFPESEVLAEEQRKLASKPVLSLENWRSYPQAYEKYFNDHFAFRPEMIRRYTRLKIFFGQSPNKNVILGEDGWLFLGFGGSRDPIADYSGTNLFSEKELKIIARNQEAQRQWLQAMNIEYYLVIAPNKESIYPEFLPSFVIKANPLTRMDQLVAVLKSQTKVNIIDLRDVLYSHKKDMLLYDKTDTHWNSYGAFLAYQKIIKEVGKKYPSIKQPRELSEFDIAVEPGDGGDLAKMLAMQDRLKENRIVLREKTSVHIPQLFLEYPVKTRQAAGDQAAFATFHDAKMPQLVMLRDSFTQGLQPFLSHHFSRAVYIWDPVFRADIIRAEKPDIVIYELVERYMKELLKEAQLDS